MKAGRPFKLTAEQTAMVTASEEPRIALAKRFNVTPQTITNIRRRHEIETYDQRTKLPRPQRGGKLISPLGGWD